MKNSTPEEKQKLTARQLMVLEFIRNYTLAEGYPPTIREIGNFMSIRSTNGVNDHLKALERKGYLTRQGLKSRTLVPTAKFNSMFPGRDKPRMPGSFLQLLSGGMITVPILGKVAAGQPILAEENAEGSVVVDSFFIGGGQRVFALRVTGDSMINDGIMDGDFIFVRKQVAAQPGDIVVAMIENEATVKRYYPEGDVIRLQPANDRMEPIRVKRSEFREASILGVVVGVYRKLRH